MLVVYEFDDGDVVVVEADEDDKMAGKLIVDKRYINGEYKRTFHDNPITIRSGMEVKKY